ncbi:chemotaxis protein CheA [Nibricoccus sp. IMCC34717]|uniref:chemotaxis protein CheA n=1 Tax=Nibricoccus sp. IMCC34717 TaxID=3034021 RepID=UPI00384D1C6E
MNLSPEELQNRTRAIFRTEAAELLGELEEALLDLESDPSHAEAINRVFRALHTLKGSGATAGHRSLSGFVHRVEDFYNSVREGRTVLNPGHIERTLEVKDTLARGIDLGEDEAQALFETAALGLEGWAVAGAMPSGTAPRAPLEERLWKITFEPRPELWRTGLDVGVFWDDLAAMGAFSLRADLSRLPALDRFDPETCHLLWSAELRGPVSEEQIREVFAFASDDAVVTVRREERPLPTQTRAPQAGEEVLKVGAEKVDKLVNLVGELVVLRAQLTNACSSLGEVPPALAAAEEGLRRLSEQMRDVVLGVRMMRIGDSFSKFRRVVRDLAAELGKEVEWCIDGADTEMDKTMLDRLAEPLLHMVRNSLDHGIETPAIRVAAGKPACGRICLRAEQRGDRVLLTLLDDGRGLDAARIRAKAVDRGLIAADASLSEKELFELIFLPGFSTAENVSQVSGRGVGMDVVKRGIESLRGFVELCSRPGGGTEVRINLPLTLAIVEGLLVETGGERYVVPLSTAHETVELPAEERGERERGQVLFLRGEALPYFRLRSLFGIAGAAPRSEKAVLVEAEGGRFAIVVDQVLGQHQTVLKSLGWLGGRVKAFSGCTVLGDGRIALVVDVNSLFTLARK